MNKKYLPGTGNSIWQNNKTVVWFILYLLLVHSVLKIIFYNYNYHLLFTGDSAVLSATKKFVLVKWALLSDLLVILVINTLLFLAVAASEMINTRLFRWFIIPLFVFLNSFALLLNFVDIFYYKFHFQRSNADLLYVLDHPLNRLLQQKSIVIVAAIACLAALVYIVWIIHKKILDSFTNKKKPILVTTLLIGFTVLLFNSNISKFVLPAYPLTKLNSNELPVVQNSFHTFFYSVFRGGKPIITEKFMPDATCDSLMPINKTLPPVYADNSRKNIVLFVMESVAFDFFDSASAFKVAMPFFDSILKKSRFYTNAFCFAHESNKGITGILAGIPTISDIPVYHSPYLNMPLTKIGKALKELDYTSLFCIGDEYDNFGFAKCMNWLEFDKYYSKESIPGYKKLSQHSMGVQDEFTLQFFGEKLKTQQQPFFATQYNVSTHYPYDIPESFAAEMPTNYTLPMKSMAYYDNSLQQFFRNAESKSWYSNTVFIFCSDHWMFPKGEKGEYNPVSGYRIPIIIFDPRVQEKRNIIIPVSQFDIIGTVLAMAGYKKNIVSFGGNLLDSSTLRPFVYSKPNPTLYQVTNERYVLGYNIVSSKPEYLFDYVDDPKLLKNLTNSSEQKKNLQALIQQVQAFIQQAYIQQQTGFKR